MGYIIGNMSLKTLAIIILVLVVVLIYSFFSERKRRPEHPSLVLFPIFGFAALTVLGERIIREFSRNERLIEFAGIVMVIICSLTFLSLFIVVYLIKRKEINHSNYRKK